MSHFIPVMLTFSDKHTVPSHYNNNIHFYWKSVVVVIQNLDQTDLESAVGDTWWLKWPPDKTCGIRKVTWPRCWLVYNSKMSNYPKPKTKGRKNWKKRWGVFSKYSSSVKNITKKIWGSREFCKRGIAAKIMQQWDIKQLEKTWHRNQIRVKGDLGNIQN